MNFIVNNGPLLKSMNNTNKINFNILISLIPILMYKTIITSYINLGLFFLIININIILLILFDYIIKSKNYKFSIYDYILPLIILFVMYLFIDNINYSNIIYIGLTNQLILFINRIIKSINPITIFLILYYIVLNNNIDIKYNIYMLSIIVLISTLYLIFTKSIKFRILITFLFFGLLSLLFKNINIELLLIMGTFVIPYFYSTPLHATSQYLYGIALALIYIFWDFKVFISIVFLLSLLIQYINLFFGIYFAKKKSY